MDMLGMLKSIRRDHENFLNTVRRKKSPMSDWKEKYAQYFLWNRMCSKSNNTHTQFSHNIKSHSKNIYAIDCTTHNSSHAHNFCKLKRLSKFSSFRTSRENSMVGAVMPLWRHTYTWRLKMYSIIPFSTKVQI